MSRSLPYHPTTLLRYILRISVNTPIFIIASGEGGQWILKSWFLMLSSCWVECPDKSEPVCFESTGYGLDGPGIESRCGRDCLHLSRSALWPTQPPVQWVPGLSQGVKSCQGMTLSPHPLLVPWSRKGRAIPLLPLWACTQPQCLYKGALYLLPSHCQKLPSWCCGWRQLILLKCSNFLPDNILAHPRRLMRTLTAVKIANAMLPNSTKLLHF
jgi:hypothetical protein